MKPWIYAALLGVLGVGAAALRFHSVTVEETRDEASISPAKVERTRKSDRGAPSPQGAWTSRGEEAAEQREGRRWAVAPAEPGVLDRLRAQRSDMPESLTETVLEGTPGAVVADSTSGEQPANHAAAAVLNNQEFSEQVRAQREGRMAFMRDRQAELASHQPGCKCASHLGEH